MSLYTNRAAPGAPYFTPAQEPKAGTFLAAKDNKPPPKLFTPLTIRGLTMQNRILVAPMDQYSSDDGHQTPYHLAHLGGIIMRGPGLTMIEGLAVTPTGRLSPQDGGIWSDAHAASMQPLVTFAHAQGQYIGAQLFHAGRKGSQVAMWLRRSAWAAREVGGWPDDLVAPSAVPFEIDGGDPCPHEMSLEDIDGMVAAFRAGAVRCVAAGLDFVEINSAHGYLGHQFLSPVSNQRTDDYGGTFENRTRMLMRIVRAVREAIPQQMPLFLRISATDWLEDNDVGITDSWTPSDATRLAVMVQDAGVDVLDVSSGGIHLAQRIPSAFPGYQAPLAQLIKKHLGRDSKMLISTVGSINSAKLAESLLQGGDDNPPLDMVAVGRGFMDNPGLVYAWAEELGVRVKVPYQLGWHHSGEIRDKILVA